MSSYTFPVLAEEASAEAGVVHTVASGDLRPSANVTCWPTQRQFEADLEKAVASLGWTVRRAHDRDGEAGHGFIDSQRQGIEVFRSHSAGRAADRRRGGLAVQPPRAGRTAYPSRPDPDRGQLERASSPGWSACSTSTASLTKAGVAHSAPVERGLHRRVGPERAADLAGDRNASTTTRATYATCRNCRRRRRWTLGRALAAPARRGRRPSSASSTRAAWACTTRSSTTSCSTRWASTRSACRQSALVAEMARVGDDEAQRRTRLARRARA